MRQHQIPQNILDIEFKLFTKFTVREFVYMALGFGIGGIFLYFFTRGELPALIAIPIFILSSGVGLFLGLVPINDQKADVFLKNYILAITNPTRRVWRSKVGQTAQQEQEILQATKGTMERAIQQNKSEIIGASSNLSTNQFIEKATIQRIEKEEIERINQITEENSTLKIDQKNQIITPPTPQTPLALEKTNNKITKPLVIPRITIDDLNYHIYKLDNNYNEKNIILVQDKNNTPITNAVIGIKDNINKIIIAQKTNEKGYVEISKKLNPNKYIIIAAYPKKTFPEYVLEINDGFKSFKITEI